MARAAVGIIFFLLLKDEEYERNMSVQMQMKHYLLWRAHIPANTISPPPQKPMQIQSTQSWRVIKTANYNQAKFFQKLIEMPMVSI